MSGSLFLGLVTERIEELSIMPIANMSTESEKADFFIIVAGQFYRSCASQVSRST